MKRDYKQAASFAAVILTVLACCVDDAPAWYDWLLGTGLIISMAYLVAIGRDTRIDWR